MRFLLLALIFASCTMNTDNSRESKIHKPESIDIKTKMKEANRYYDQDKYELARAIYENIIDSDTTIGEVYYKLGYSIGQMQSDTFFINHPSVKHFIKAAELNYRPDEAYRNAALYILNDDSAKLKYLNKSLELNPEQPEIIQFRDGLNQLLLKQAGLSDV